jgi:glyoxylase-like metal-dependent hydrolase (beta-lactamase superfamily II)|tara:strand:- start:927 stop:1277 length:351 start_codon:yes stop_codon:yes gene_type:complete
VIFEQIFAEGLAHSSYLIGDQGVCAVIDPKRGVDTYLEMGENKSLQITHIVETHFHADFLSGHLELAAKTGVKVCVSKKAAAEYEHIPLEERDEFETSGLKFKTMETPGHTLNMFA